MGLVVAPAAMQDAGWVVTRSGSELIERQERYRESLEALGSDEEADAEDRELGFSRIETLLVDHLGWSGDQVQSDPNLIEGYTRDLPELGETLQPSAVVPAAAGDGAQLLVQELPLLTPLDQKVTGGEHLWRASAQERFERLLRETGVEAGLLFNGSQLRLVVAPKGESSGHITFSLKDLAAVSGRLMFSGLDLLLGQSHVFLDPDGYRLADVLKKSRSFQAVVSNALADQVLAALWELLRGFQQADELTQRQGGLLLGHLAENEPKQLYGGLITVLMRLVFLLYAEDNALLPKDAVYEQNYKVSGVFERLEQDAAEFPDTMEQRYGAWAGLMSLCQLVFAGGGATVDYLPARKGQLFDPAVYPWLETPWISDGVVHEVLSNLLVVKGERISYRALDVEQIGSVYEGIMGYAVRRIPGRCIGLKSKPQGAKKQLTTAVDLDALLALPGGKRKAWLEEEAATTLPPKSANALKAATSEGELLEALAPRINHELFDGPQAAGSLVFQPTEERRRSGSHYTPRSLTRPIVEEALRPWLERCGGKPTVAQILALKICDPAMGSGAFLVECCRYLAELLEQAWVREGLPEELKPGGHALGEEPLIYARRLIAQSCLYGVDKNPFAVNLARLSLWLVSLSKDAPFTFVDHALKCGDSLVGMERAEIEKALKGASLQRDLQMAYLDQVRQQEARSFALFHADSRSDADDAQKRQALDDLNASTAYLRTVGDLLVAAFFNGKKPKDREELKQLYLEATLQHNSADELEAELAEPLERLREGEKGIQPLHWQLAFPDVFGRDQPGFDVFIGNPPFLGGSRIAGALGYVYSDYLTSRTLAKAGAADLCAYFFRELYKLLRPKGAMAFVATNSISETATRRVGLAYIQEHDGEIYSAVTDRDWPGIASVVITIICACKGGSGFAPILNDRVVDKISPALLGGIDIEEAKRLNHGISFSQGVCLIGSAFVVDYSDLELIRKDNPGISKYLRRYVNGDILNNCIGQDGGRYVIDFGERSLDEIRDCGEILKVICRVNSDERKKYTQQVHEDRPWLFWDKRTEFFDKARRLERILACTRVAKHLFFEFVDPHHLYSDAVILFCDDRPSLFAVLQSTLHSCFVAISSSRLGKATRYSTSTSFSTFPLPASEKLVVLSECGSQYHQIRSAISRELGIGLTSVYNLFHSPIIATTESEINALRSARRSLDKEVLNSYGWHDLDLSYGFALEELDMPEDVEMPDAIACRTSGGSYFFPDAYGAIRFQEYLRSMGISSSKGELAWRYRWPDAVRDTVLARLLALNAERYEEEVAQGLHSKGGKKAAATAAAGGKRRGRPAKAADPADTEQIGLAL
ncbi:Eco57I restriction-modification methylase domain-containing protein [Cyanobium sp. ATX 6E8]|uniref:Eco57I restriction-modification methylase domain-containing protein n=1 Tax=Cyanobium sp. ATX 6E8 TaxID=2823701 RepID=UPI0020CC0B9D|nr:DNA methyltransferase [Cyanobium sp. ATX 6E8]